MHGQVVRRFAAAGATVTLAVIACAPPSGQLAPGDETTAARQVGLTVTVPRSTVVLTPTPLRAVDPRWQHSQPSIAPAPTVRPLAPTSSAEVRLPAPTPPVEAPTASPTPPATPTAAVPTALPARRGDEVMDAVARARPSVVQVLTPKNSGTGIILSSDGRVLTNRHVVEGAQSVQIRLADGRRVGVRVLRSAQTPDLALLQADAAGLAPAEWGDSDRLALGQPVIVIGYAVFVDGDPTVSRGVVSAIRPLDGVRYVQTDAAINPGDSGGPLIDTTGSVVGVATKVIRGNDGVIQGINLAIAAGEARRWLEQ